MDGDLKHLASSDQKVNVRAHIVAIVIKIWQTWPHCGNNNQNVANMPRVAIMIKMWQTLLQCGNSTQNVANMPTEWQS